MPAPPSSSQKAANQKSMNASKSNNYGGINTSTVKTNSQSSRTSFGSGGGGNSNSFGGINTSTVRTNPVGSRTSFGSGGTGGLLGQTYSGPKGAGLLNNAARMAHANQMGYRMPNVNRTTGDAEALGRMMMAESQNIRNPMGGINTAALQGVGDVVRNRMLSDRFPNTVGGVMGQPKQFSPMGDGSFAKTPPSHMATSVAESILSGETPPVVGGALNYANLNTVNRKPGYSSPATKQAFNTMEPMRTFADAQSPQTFQHTFGTIGKPTDVAFNGMARPPAQMASVAPMNAPPAPQTPSAGGGWLENMQKLGAQAVNYVDENLVQPTQEQVAKYGGFKRAGKLARMAVEIMNFLPGGNGMANNQLRPGTGGGNEPQAQPATPPVATAMAPPVATAMAPPPSTNQVPPALAWQYPQYSQASWAPQLRLS